MYTVLYAPTLHLHCMDLKLICQYFCWGGCGGSGCGGSCGGGGCGGVDSGGGVVVVVVLVVFCLWRL